MQSATSISHFGPFGPESWHRSWFEAMSTHWPEYLMEAAELGVFMISACVFATVLAHPSSPLGHWVPSHVLQRILMGMAMGASAVAIIYSPWGKRSGAHFNPSVTLTFLQLGKVRLADAVRDGEQCR